MNMQLYSKLIILLLMVGMGVSSCTKGTRNDKQFLYGQLDFSVAALPNAPEMDVYINGDSVGTISAVINPIVYRGETGEKKQVNIYKKDTKELLADTLIQLIKDKTIFLKAAVSEPLGMSGFLNASTEVDADSCRIQLFNGLPLTIQPEGVEVDAIIYYEGQGGEFIELMKFEHFERNKLHPLTATILNRNYYVLKFRNRATGEFLTDSFFSDNATWSPVPGKYCILSAIGYEMGAWNMLYIDWAEL